jgi:capsular exopolysaccharide synthesis family protein
MSQIFDALQRSETERSGLEADLKQPTFTVATELLQVAERKRRAAVNGNGNAAEPTSLPVAFEQFPSLPVSILPESRLIAAGHEDSLGAEKFRFLGVRLRQLRQNHTLNKVLITSTIPEEGKSTVAANLACTLARRKQHKTLLLEGDLRRPTLTQRFGLGNVPGLSEWLSGTTETRNIYRLESLGLWVLPAGYAPENPLELMQTGKLASFMDQLTAWFDWIVIDSPPVLPLADTSIWSRFSDGILLVTRNGVTEKKQLQRGLDAVDRSKLLGAIVNGSTDTAHNDYYQRYAPATATPARSGKQA